MNPIVENIILAASTALVTWFFSRKKQEADVKIIELNNVDKAITIWRGIAEDLGAKVDVLTLKCDALSLEIEVLRKENKSLKYQLEKAIATYKPDKN